MLEVEPDVAWERARHEGRPLAQDETAFRALYDARLPVYEEAADARVGDAEGAILAAAGIHVERGAVDVLAELVPGSGPVEIVADRHVAGIHGVRVQLALGTRDVGVHEVPQGEAAKAPSVVERLWSGFTIGRDGVVVALGGGTTTDVAGFAAATFMRGVDWVAVPTTLVGQVDAAIGGKTAIDLPGAKNLAGAFHWPAKVVADPTLLETLPDSERRNGLAEVVKTGLLAGEPFWELSEHEQVRRCAVFKGAVCLRDPEDRGPRNQLNLGHTFAHALEAAAGYALPHGEAVALGLLAALRLSGLEEERRLVERVLRPERPKVDRDAAWVALGRDKKAALGRPGSCCWMRPGSRAGVSSCRCGRPGGARRGDRGLSVSGGCLCGGVRFEVDEPLRDIVVCHCSLCRRAGTMPPPTRAHRGRRCVSRERHAQRVRRRERPRAQLLLRPVARRCSGRPPTTSRSRSRRGRSTVARACACSGTSTSTAPRTGSGCRRTRRCTAQGRRRRSRPGTVSRVAA